MAAYVVTIDTQVWDLEGLAGLADSLVEAVGAYGGRYIIRTGAIEPKGGSFTPARMAVAEFESIDQIRELFSDAKFLELRKRRSSFAHANVFVVEGAQ